MAIAQVSNQFDHLAPEVRGAYREGARLSSHVIVDGGLRAALTDAAFVL